jgi:transcriptional regulator
MSSNPDAAFLSYICFMYDLPHFKAASQGEVLAFMKAHPFIVLCGTDITGKPVATHIPVLFEEREGKLFLLAHVMKKQDHTLAFIHQEHVLAIFEGPHTYVSASWYQNKLTASTWNYQAVHAKGILKFLDEEALRQILTKLTEHFEGNPHSPSLVDGMPADYVKDMMKAIVAFEIEITSLEHVFKLSQNRDEKTYESIVDELAKGTEDAKAISQLMENRKQDVFKGA